MNPNCRKRMGAIRLENMKVIDQEEIAPAIFELRSRRRNGRSYESGAISFIYVYLMMPTSCVVQFQFHLSMQVKNNVI